MVGNSKSDDILFRFGVWLGWNEDVSASFDGTDDPSAASLNVAKCSAMRASMTERWANQHSTRSWAEMELRAMAYCVECVAKRWMDFGWTVFHSLMGGTYGCGL